MKRRGALELSINTIVVVVIAITLLTLGLAFVKQQFGGLTDITKDVFGTAKTEIGKIHGGAKFTAPTQVTVKQGETTTIAIFVANDGSLGGDTNVELKLSTIGGTPGTSCTPIDGVSARIISSPTATLKVGQEAAFTVAVAATKLARLSTGSSTDPACSIVVTATGATGTYASGGFVIEVQPTTGIF